MCENVDFCPTQTDNGIKFFFVSYWLSIDIHVFLFWMYLKRLITSFYSLIFDFIIYKLFLYRLHKSESNILLMCRPKYTLCEIYGCSWKKIHNFEVYSYILNLNSLHHFVQKWMLNPLVYYKLWYLKPNPKKHTTLPW